MNTVLKKIVVKTIGKGESACTYALPLDVAPAFWQHPKQDDDVPLHYSETPPFSIDKIPGKGLGMQATSVINTGDLILQERPLLISTHDAYSFSPILNHMTAGRRDAFKMLHSYNGHGRAENNLCAVNLTNGIDVTHPSLGDDSYGAVCKFISRVNHSCMPNAVWYWNHELLCVCLVAARDISQGEEITVTYIDPLVPSEARISELKTNYGFICDCLACSPENRIRSDRVRYIIAHCLDPDIDCICWMNDPESHVGNLMRMSCSEGLEVNQIMIATHFARLEAKKGHMTKAQYFAWMALDELKRIQTDGASRDWQDMRNILGSVIGGEGLN